MIKAILLDFNGVIINDEPVQMAAYQEVLKKDGIDLTEADYYASLGMDDRTFVSAAFDRASRSVEEAKIDEVVAAKSAKWEELVSGRLPLFDGIENFVEKMANEFALGIVSMAGRAEIDLVLEKSGMKKHFSVVVSAKDVDRCKPDPQCFKIGFKQIDAFRIAQGHSPLTLSQCLVIEDSPPGIAAARSAGLQALGVANTVDAAELRKAGAAAVATDLNDWMPDSIRRVF